MSSLVIHKIVMDMNRRREDVWIEEDKYEFAELIVKECIQVLTDRYQGDMSRQDQDLMRCIYDIKQHFEIKPKA